MKITLMNGNVLDMLKKIPDESVDCVVTSPPYYGLRSYKGADTIWGGDSECEHEWVIGDHKYRSGGVESANTGNDKKSASHLDYYSNTCSKCGAWKGQLGLEPTYQMYIEHLMLVTKELKRVLKKTGTLFWNMGDSYAGNMGSRAGWQDSKYSGTREEGINNGVSLFLKADYGNIQTKSLMMMPERFAMAMIDDGWILRNKIVWFKRNGIPSSVKDRLSNKWEYVFFFTKSKRYYFDLDSIRNPLLESPANRTSHKNIAKLNMEKKITEYSGIYSNITSEESEIYGSPRARNMRKFASEKQDNQNGANPGDVNFDETAYYSFNDPNIQIAFIDFLERERPELLMPVLLDIPTRPHKFAHFAVFPETLVMPLIKAGCPVGGTVLDPFAGSGTTGVIAEILGRNSILIDISSEYVDIINERFKPENLEKVKDKLFKKDKKKKTKQIHVNKVVKLDDYIEVVK